MCVYTVCLSLDGKNSLLCEASFGKTDHGGENKNDSLYKEMQKNIYRRDLAIVMLAFSRNDAAMRISRNEDRIKSFLEVG